MARGRDGTGVEEADYVVVGAGSAGAVIASRLSESGRHRVVLLEAGGRDRNPWIHVPLGFARLFFNPRTNWGDMGAAEPGLGGRQIFYPHGKVLGGSSSVNGMIYIRGQREDYDGWRELGNVGWGYEDVLPYFRKAENQQHGADRFHGAGGPIAVSDHFQPHPACDAYIAAAGENGIPHNRDFNGAESEGAGYYQLTTNGWRRSSTAVGYLRPARRRPNLRIVTGAQAMRVVVEGGRAVGVEYRQGDATRRIDARAEVILSGGVFNSPHLLQLSGIGPAERLRAAGIAPVHDLAGVGESLEDHYVTSLVYEMNGPLSLNGPLGTLRGRVGMALDYALRRRGPLTIGAAYAGGFYRTDAQANRADVQSFFMIYSSDDYRTPHPFPGVGVAVFQSRPESRGWVRTQSPDPFQRPEIRFNYLTAEKDRQTLVAGIRLIRRIMAAPAMAPLVARAVSPAAEPDSDAALLDWARARGGSGYHGTSTCRMGQDATAVVDERLRVRGLGRLRVADGSIMPAVPSGNTNAPIIMIGEKAADLILEDAR